MRRTLTTTASTILLIAAHASAQPVANLRCDATHSVECKGADCRSERPEEGDVIYVGFELSPVSGRGKLCTYTYCRDFVLVPLPGDSLDEALKKLSGFTLSQSRGSAVEDLELPAIDYQLSISEDRSRFFLGNLLDGGFAGWTGTCTTTP
ncbi:MAG TPA: hypothetical protein VFO36_01670 [Nitrospiraceae bacterium]|nr:hypothetical protein [Nitrospiraceae bacterium]